MKFLKHVWADAWIRISICAMLLIILLAMFSWWGLFAIPFLVAASHLGTRWSDDGYGPYYHV